MKGLIELNNIAVETVNSKSTTLSKTEGKGEVKVKMYGKCMGKIINWIFSNAATVGFKFDVRLSCRARRALFSNLRPFINPSSNFRENLKIKNFYYRKCIGRDFVINFWEWCQCLSEKFSFTKRLSSSSSTQMPLGSIIKRVFTKMIFL